MSAIKEPVDVIFCLGIYYHLHDPFYAFSQIRHLCHDKTIVVFEGDTAASLKSSYTYWDPTDGTLPLFVPHRQLLNNMLRSAYLEVQSQTSILANPWLSPRQYAHLLQAVAERKRMKLPPFLNRTVTVCRPFRGDNALHPYLPPFGLAQYDGRFSLSS